MRRWLSVTVALAAITGLAWWWYGLDERRVRARLDEAAAAVSTSAGESDIGRVTRAASLARSLAPEIVLVAPGGTLIEGRDAVMGVASRLASASPFRVELADVDVGFDEAGRAVATATALIGEGADDPHGVNGQEFRFELRSEGGEWLISRAEVLAALER